MQSNSRKSGAPKHTTDSKLEVLHCCKICSRVFQTFTGLHSHMKCHTDYTETYPYKCKLCNKSYLTKQGLKKHNFHHHQTSAHSPKSNSSKKKSGNVNAQKKRTAVQSIISHPFKCVKCGKSYANEANLYRHIRTSHKRSNSCSWCSSTFSSNMQKMQHMRLKHGNSTEHKCRVCLKVFLTSATLKSHMESHMNKKNSYNCSICQTKLSSKTNLDKHIKLTHKKINGRFQCPVCKTLISNKSNLARHIKYFHGKNKPEFKCEFCQAIYSYPESLERHLKINHGQKKLKMRRQSSLSSFPSKGKVDQHVRPSHGKSNAKLKCEFCQSTFYSKWNLDRHVKMHHTRNNAGIKCRLCPSFLSSKEGFDRHMNLKHKKKSFDFECHLCTSVLSTKGSLCRHLKLSHGKKNAKFNCHLCSSVLTTKGSLIQHLKDSHGENSDLYFKCNFCSKMFLRMKELGAHVRTHSQEHPEVTVKNPETCWRCDICKRLLQSKTALVNHLKTHKDHQMIGLEIKKRYKCFYCVSSFTKTGNLRRHIRMTHQKMKIISSKIYSNNDKFSFKKGKGITGHSNPYKCVHCFMSFSQSYHLQNHLRTHNQRTNSGVNFSNKIIDHDKKGTTMVHVKSEFECVTPKNYDCPVCDKTFIASNSLKIHIRTHTGEKPFICPCEKSFSQLIHLQKHMKTHLNPKGYFYWENFKPDMIPTNREDYVSVYKSKLNKLKPFVPKDTSSEPLACPSCNKEFHHFSSLKRHSLHKHNRTVRKEAGKVKKCFVRLCRCPTQERYILKTDHNGNLTLKSSTSKHKKLPDCRFPYMPLNCRSGQMQPLIKKEFHTPIKKESPFVCGFCFEEFICKPTLLEHVKMHLIQHSYKQKHEVGAMQYKLPKQIKTEPGIVNDSESSSLSHGPPVDDAVESRVPSTISDAVESSTPNVDSQTAMEVISRIQVSDPPESSYQGLHSTVGEIADSNPSILDPPDDNEVTSSTLDHPYVNDFESSMHSQDRSVCTNVESSTPSQDSPAGQYVESSTPSQDSPAGNYIESSTPSQDSTAGNYVESSTPSQDSPAGNYVESSTPSQDSPAGYEIESYISSQDHPVCKYVESSTPSQGHPYFEDVESSKPSQYHPYCKDVESRALSQYLPLCNDVKSSTSCKDHPVGDDVESSNPHLDPLVSDVSSKSTSLEPSVCDDVECSSSSWNSHISDVKSSVPTTDPLVRDVVLSTPNLDPGLGDDVEDRISRRDPNIGDDVECNPTSQDNAMNVTTDSFLPNLYPSIGFEDCTPNLDSPLGSPEQSKIHYLDLPGCDSCVGRMAPPESEASLEPLQVSSAVIKNASNTSLGPDCYSDTVPNLYGADTAETFTNISQIKLTPNICLQSRKKIYNQNKKTYSRSSVEAKKLKRRAIVALNRPNLECFVCDVPLHSQEKFDEHMRIHTGETPFECPHCDMTFMRTGSRAAHVRLLHRSTVRGKDFDTEDLTV